MIVFKPLPAIPNMSNEVDREVLLN